LLYKPSFVFLIINLFDEINGGLISSIFVHESAAQPNAESGAFIALRQVFVQTLESLEFHEQVGHVVLQDALTQGNVVVQVTFLDHIEQVVHDETDVVGSLVALLPGLDFLVDQLELKAGVVFHALDDLFHLLSLNLGYGSVRLDHEVFLKLLAVHTQ